MLPVIQQLSELFHVEQHFAIDTTIAFRYLSIAGAVPVPEREESVNTTIDNPHIRNSTVCPLCDGYKPVGLVACWQCFRSEELSNGNPDAESALDQREAALREGRAAA